MDQSPVISVIVPVYQVELYLRCCLDSICAQTERNLEILLIDDGSTDSSGKICDEYAERDSRIRVIHKENGGLSSARNVGLNCAAGEYIAFVDSDDFLEPNMLRVMLDAARTNEVPLVCVGRFNRDARTGEETIGLCPVRDEVVSGQELARRIFLTEHLDSAAWDKLYRRELFREIRYPLGVISEDVPTTYRLALLAGNAALIAKPMYHYLHRENSLSTSMTASEHTFDFSDHCAGIYSDICAHIPELEPEARCFRIRSLIYNVLILELSDKTVRRRYSERYWASRQELQRNLGFLMTYHAFALTERCKAVLLMFGLYPILRKIYHFGKQS